MLVKHENQGEKQSQTAWLTMKIRLEPVVDPDLELSRERFACPAGFSSFIEFFFSFFTQNKRGTNRMRGWAGLELTEPQSLYMTQCCTCTCSMLLLLHVLWNFVKPDTFFSFMINFSGHGFQVNLWRWQDFWLFLNSPSLVLSLGLGLLHFPRLNSYRYFYYWDVHGNFPF